MFDYDRWTNSRTQNFAEACELARRRFRPGSIKAKDALICWERCTPFVMVVPFPDRERLRPDGMSHIGACMVEWQEANAAKRKLLMYFEYVTLLVRDKVPADALHRAFLTIREYRDGLSFDTPGAK